MGLALGAIMEEEIRQIPAVFERIAEALAGITEEVSKLPLASIDSVILVARGTSDNAALYLKYLIETKIGIPCGMASPSVVTIYGARLRYRKVLVVALSQSGQSPDLVGYCQAAVAGGAQVLAITNDEMSPLAQSAHAHLSLFAGPERAVAATKSYSAQLLLSRIFVAIWKGESVNIPAIIEQAQRVLLEAENINLIAQKFDIQAGVTTMGRGFAYANAQEAALKIQETVKIPVASFSTADYLHGPISSLHQESRVIFLAPSGIAPAAISATVERAREITPFIYWIGAGYPPREGEISLGGSEALAEEDGVIVDSIVLQLLALSLARCAGKNPDAPLGLLKVTKTV